MFIRMLTAMAGGSFSYAHGETVQVEDAIGKAWIRAGLAEASPSAAAAERAAKDLQAQVTDLQDALHEAEADRDALRDQVAVLAEQNAALTARLAQAGAEASAS